MEKRKITRITYNNLLVLKTDEGEEIVAKVENISLKGGFIILKDGKQFNIGDVFTFIIVISAGEDIRIEGKARVVWQDESHGYGLACDEMDLDYFTNLKRLLELNYEDADIIKEEIAHLVGNVW